MRSHPSISTPFKGDHHDRVLLPCDRSGQECVSTAWRGRRRLGGVSSATDAATKLLWLALRNITADWGRAAKEWKEAMNQFAIAYGERFTQPAA
jgi:hypothetical protein